MCGGENIPARVNHTTKEGLVVDVVTDGIKNHLRKVAKDRMRHVNKIFCNIKIQHQRQKRPRFVLEWM